MAESEHLADQFHTATLAGDASTLRSILAPDVTFTGPLAQASGVDDCVAGLVEMAKMTTGDEVAVRLADDRNVLVWSTMRTTHAPPLRTATWLRIKDGRIAEIQTLFDPRGSQQSGR